MANRKKDAAAEPEVVVNGKNLEDSVPEAEPMFTGEEAVDPGVEVTATEVCEPSPEPPAKPKRAAKAYEPPVDLTQYRYTSPVIDREVDIVKYEAIRGAEVDQAEMFLTSITQRMEHLVGLVYSWMQDPDTNPYKGLRLPMNTSQTSLAEIMDLLGTAQNAVQQFGEIRSVLSAIVYQRNIMLERRKTAALINEGRNEQERKGLSSMRSDPEAMQLAKVQIALHWAEPRYYAYGKMVDTLQQMLTSKSVSMTREQKDAEAERYGT